MRRKCGIEMWCTKHGWLQLCGLDFDSESRKFGVSESLDQSLPRHGESLSSEPLLQNAARNPLWIPAVFVLDDVHLIPRLVIEEEDSKCGVACGNPLGDFQTK